jgi:cardiolipin synthase
LRGGVKRLARLRGRLFQETPRLPGNRVQLLVDGGPFFDALEAAINSAEVYLWIETYILRDDDTGWRIAGLLAERAKAGVEVALCYDGFGSLGIDDAFVDYLRVAGVKLLEFAPLTVFGRWPWLRRNHRKLVVVDGRLGIIGGMNIAADYDSLERGGANWRDTGVQIEGPAVAQLEAMFRRTWSRYGDHPLASPIRAAPTFPENEVVRFIGNHARRNRAEIRRAYLRAFLTARKSIRIQNAYFSPDPVVLRALVRAARRGVKVELITAAATDVWPVLMVSRGLYGVLLRAGVVIYEWHERVLHGKTAVVDGEWTTVGSANFTHRAFLLDLEVNATILGTRIGAEMDALFDADIARCQRIDRALWQARPRSQRLLEWFFGLFRRLI